VNKRQRVVVLVGVAVVAGMMLFPPWQYKRGSYKIGGITEPVTVKPAGYGFIFNPPASAETVDISRLAVQCAVVAVLAFGACVALSRKSGS